MRLYHSRLTLLLIGILLAGCAAPPAAAASLVHRLWVDGREREAQAAPGTTVAALLAAQGVSLGPLDRVEPEQGAALNAPSSIRVVRVTEKFETVRETLPFEHQILRNESLPQGEENQVLLQPGQNGLREITLRRVYEDGQEVSSSPVKSVVVQEPVAEILMIGIQAPFFPIRLPGRLVYLRDGNVWLMEGTTGTRQAVVTEGDLDGRIFSLAPARDWLLFTRRSEREGEINRLWAVDLNAEEARPIDLNVPNVVHFADWVPGAVNKIVFSTVEPRAAAPGWQANNDLNALTLSSSGWTSKWDVIVEPNSGGVYGWWGATFLWEPLGARLAMIRSDGVSLVDFKEGVQTPLVSSLPYTTRGDWAWVPGATWGPDGLALYLTQHSAPEGAANPEESQVFDLAAVPLASGQSLPLLSQTGMFAYPLASPLQPQPGGETAFQIAFLQATFPTQSETSRYHVALVDRDGSNLRQVFPAEGLIGLTPQREWAAWSPQALPESGHFALALLYEGNLWLVDAATGEAQQVTGDGLTTRLVWK